MDSRSGQEALPVLWQAEWCPWSHRVRARLTELGVEYVARQVPVDKAERGALVAATGAQTIPVLVLADGSVVAGSETILAHLDATLAEPPAAAAHRAKAELEHRKHLEEECGCPQPAADSTPLRRAS